MIQAPIRLHPLPSRAPIAVIHPVGVRVKPHLIQLDALSFLQCNDSWIPSPYLRDHDYIEDELTSGDHPEGYTLLSQNAQEARIAITPVSSFETNEG